MAMEKMLQLLHRDGSRTTAQGGKSRRVPRKQSTGAVTTSSKSKNDHHQQYGKSQDMESATQARQDRVVGVSGSPTKNARGAARWCGEDGTHGPGTVAAGVLSPQARHEVHSRCSCSARCQCLSAGTLQKSGIRDEREILETQDVPVHFQTITDIFNWLSGASRMHLDFYSEKIKEWINHTQTPIVALNISH